ncbi:MAG: thioredoxin family protein [Planctomycetota bacterium]|nr:thioredoxin family protein [Planctomycetota bacterium]
MAGGGKFAIVVAVAVAVFAVLLLKNQRPAKPPSPETAAATVAEPPARTSLPRLVDLGSNNCHACKMMKPVLDDLKRDYADKFSTEFIDVGENPNAATQYGVRLIPTQIFYDASGKELFRHEGFLAKEDIIGKWKELGFDFGSKGGAAQEQAR